MTRAASAALAAALLAAGAAAPASAQPASASAELHDVDGAAVGTVTLTQTPAGVLIDARLSGLPEGAHGFHIHETGACSPDFSAAGGHFVGDGDAHGFLADDDPHGGDMPNIHVPASGELHVEILNDRIELAEASLLEDEEALFDDDGAAIVIHSGADDYRSQPSGAAGERIACGVIEAEG